MAFIKLDKRYLTIANLLDELRYVLKMPILSLPKYWYEDWGMKLGKKTCFAFRATYSPSIDSLSLKDIPDQLTGGFQPFANIAIDFLLPICPYFSLEEALKELAQPILGIANLLKAAIYLLAAVLGAPILFIIFPLVILLCPDCTWDKKIKYFKDCFGLGGGILLSWFIDGIGTAIRGGLQIIFTPAIPLKMCMRGVCSLISIYRKSQYPEINTIDDLSQPAFPNLNEENTVKPKPFGDIYNKSMDGLSNVRKYGVPYVPQQNERQTFLNNLKVEFDRPFDPEEYANSKNDRQPFFEPNKKSI